MTGTRKTTGYSAWVVYSPFFIFTSASQKRKHIHSAPTRRVHWALVKRCTGLVLIWTHVCVGLTEDALSGRSVPSTHLFVLVNQDVKRTQLEDQQTPEQLNITFALIGFLCVFEVDVGFTQRSFGSFSRLADEFNRRSLYHGAAIRLLLLLLLFSSFGGCDCWAASRRRNPQFSDAAGVCPDQGCYKLSVRHAFFAFLSGSCTQTETGRLLCRLDIWSVA